VCKQKYIKKIIYNCHVADTQWRLMEILLPYISMVILLFYIHVFTWTTLIPEGMCGFINNGFPF